MIGWSRIRLRCHTPAQVTVGAIMGAAVGGVVFGLLR
ncbi:phosphatase PAP2 family protein [Streptomyces sp. MS1.AVA.1]|uniref:Phosphatase PAP2 family protein n=1 Tax=Streptomyces machairae TaxID=3134109 RepID=A0ABU8UX76_9ACTN